jgi:hypothetical protein
MQSGTSSGYRIFLSLVNDLSGNISESRITRDWKVNISGNLNQNEEKYIIDISVGYSNWQLNIRTLPASD